MLRASLDIEMAGLLDGLCVLIAEDEPLIGLSVEESIRNAGGDTVLVQNDRAAYAELEARAGKLHMLILDVNLGEGTTGFDIARFARRLDPDIAVVYLSGGPEEWAAWFGVEGAAFLGKPISEMRLLETIARLTGRGAAPNAPMPRPA
ncbi:response regulator [Sphingomonas tabacisoli]|uniref:Response regulator n=1 Tax=Sphingomonas tabacisoli TaxID=2249466 RepID=A0ABW4HZA0_9SPHN